MVVDVGSHSAKKSSGNMSALEVLIDTEVTERETAIQLLNKHLDTVSKRLSDGTRYCDQSTDDIRKTMESLIATTVFERCGEFSALSRSIIQSFIIHRWSSSIGSSSRPCYSHDRRRESQCSCFCNGSEAGRYHGHDVPGRTCPDC